MMGVVSKACYNFILQLTTVLQIIGWYYVNKLLELQLMNTSYRQILRIDYRSETWDIYQSRIQILAMLGRSLQKML